MTLNKTITRSQASKKKRRGFAVKGYEELARATEIKSLMRQTQFVKVSDFGQVLS